MNYIALRAKMPRLSRFDGETPNQPWNNYVPDFYGRSVIDMRSILRKMFIKPKLASFTLQDSALHPSLMKEPVVINHCFLDSYNMEKNQLIHELEFESSILDKICNNNSSVSMFVELSFACSAPITKMVSSGEQIRVWSNFKVYFEQNGFVADKQTLESKVPVTVRKLKRNSSYPDPEERKIKRKKKKKVQRDLFGREVGKDVFSKRKKAKKTKKYAGGYVAKPIVGNYRGKSIYTFDFSSMYPSIMTSYRVCYMKVIYSKDMLKDPDIEFEYLSMNESECLVLVKSYKGKPVDTFLPEIMTEVVKARKNVKRERKANAKQTEETKAILDEGQSCSGDVWDLLDHLKRESKRLKAKELGMKVFQNAHYGFLGARLSPLFALPVLMATVCALGQYMIKRCAHYFITVQNAIVVYGDTDSVMIWFEKIIGDLPLKDLERMAEDCTRMFPIGNVLEIESLKKNFILYGKKNYIGIEFDFGSKSYSVKVSGLGVKKQNYCKYVHIVGDKVVNKLLSDSYNDSDLSEYLSKSVKTIVDGKVPMDELSVSCSIQSDYKSDNLIQLETAKKIQERTGKTFGEGSRVNFVVTKGSEKLYKRGEDPSVTKYKNIDLEYYLMKQLAKPIGKIIMFNPSVLKSWQRDVSRAKCIIQSKCSGMKPLI